MPVEIGVRKLSKRGEKRVHRPELQGSVLPQPLAALYGQHVESACFVMATPRCLRRPAPSSPRRSGPVGEVAALTASSLLRVDQHPDQSFAVATALQTLGSSPDPAPVMWREYAGQLPILTMARSSSAGIPLATSVRLKGHLRPSPFAGRQMLPVPAQTQPRSQVRFPLQREGRRCWPRVPLQHRAPSENARPCCRCLT